MGTDVLTSKTLEALELCLQPQKLNGKQVRLIRKAMGMKGQKLAEMLGINGATLSRWEHDKQQVGLWADKALRMAAVLYFQGILQGEASLSLRVVNLNIRPCEKRV